MPSEKSAAYCRVSSAQQAKGETIETQREAIGGFCQIRPIVLYDYYLDEDKGKGVSGMIPFPERPEGRRLLADARLGRFSEVIVYKTARLGRDFLETTEILKIFRDLGLLVRSVTEQYDASTPDGRFMQAIHAIVAEKAREDIVQHSTAGSSRVARAGAWMGGVPPFGYRTTGSGHQRRLVVHEEEAAIVVQIYHWMIEERMACSAIGRRLMAMGVQLPFAREGLLWRGEPTSGRWEPTRVRSLLANPLYKGVSIYGKKSKVREPITRPAPAIVTPEVWELARLRLQENLRFSPRNMKKRHYLLSGLIRCGLCGGKYIGIQSNRSTKINYVCGSKNHGRCSAPNVEALMIEAVVWEQVKAFLNDPGVAVGLLREAMGRRQGEMEEIGATLASLTAGVQKKDTARLRVIELYEEEQITRADLVTRMAAITAEREAILAEEGGLREQIAQLQDMERQLSMAGDYLHGLGDGLVGEPDFAGKRDVVRRLLQEVVVYARETPAGVVPRLEAKFLFTDCAVSPTISKLTLALCLEGLPLAA